MYVNFNILNQLGSPSINSNTFANRPAAGQTGRLFVSTDTFEIYRDNGTTWDLIGGPGAGTITGSGTATQVAYFTGAQTIGSSANLFWDNTNTRLGIGTATPGSRLDIHGTGTLQQLNSTGTTNNNYLAFQRSGTSVWRIGDTYNGGTNFFSLYNATNAIDAVIIDNSTNKGVYSARETIGTGLALGSQFNYQLNVPNGTTFGTPNAITALGMFTDISLLGSSTVPIGTRQGFDANQRLSFNVAGTMTVTQGSTVRAFSNLNTAWSFNGTQVGTVTHLAGIRVVFPDNIGSAVNVTNNYGILINNQTTGLGTVNYTNRWGIYQEGTSDINTFAGNVLVGTTTNVGANIYTNGSLRTDSSTTLAATSGGVLIGSTGAISTNAALQIDSTSAGVLLPRMTTAQRNAISGGPSAGLVIYNTTTTALEFYNGTAWTSGGGGGITGSGTTNYLPKFTAGTVVGDSRFFDNGTITFLGNGDVNAAPSTGIFSGTGGTGTNIAGAELRIRGGASTGNAAGGPITFYTSAAGSAGTGVNAATEVMRIINTTLSSGAVRIGSTTHELASNRKLTVLGVAGIEAVVTGTTGEPAIEMWQKATTGNNVFVEYLTEATATTRGRNVYDRTNNAFGINGVNALTLQTGGTNRLFINSSGSIGLSTTTIGSTLQVNGNAAIGYSASTAAPTNGLAVAGQSTFADNISYTNNRNAGNVVSITNTNNNALSDVSLQLNSSGTGSTILGKYSQSSSTYKILGASDGFLYNKNTGDIVIFNDFATGNIRFGAGGTSTTQMTLTSGGQVTLATGSNVSAIAQTGYSLTGSNASSLLDLAGTWNTTGNPTALKLNITNTASGASAYLMDLQVGAATQFRVTKAGAIRTAAPTTGTANDWKLGSRVAAAVVLDTTQYIELEVGGTLYKLAIVN